MTAIETIGKLLDGWGTSDAYGSETVYLHESEIEKLALENRRATRGDSANPRGWPSDTEARAGFEPLVKTDDTMDDFCRRWEHLQKWRDKKLMGGAGVESKRAGDFKLWQIILAILDTHDHDEA